MIEILKYIIFVLDLWLIVLKFFNLILIFSVSNLKILRLKAQIKKTFLRTLLCKCLRKMINESLR